MRFAREFNISSGTIAIWETGRREPDFETTQRIADYFGVSVDYLIGHEVDKTKHNKNPLTEQWQGDLMQTLETIGALEPTSGLNEKGREVITEFLQNNATVLKKLINEGD